MTSERRAQMRREAKASWAKKTPEEKAASMGRLFAEIGENAALAEMSLEKDHAAIAKAIEKEARKYGMTSEEFVRRALDAWEPPLESYLMPPGLLRR